jgi:hypothetical protein
LNLELGELLRAGLGDDPLRIIPPHFFATGAEMPASNFLKSSRMRHVTRRRYYLGTIHVEHRGRYLIQQRCGNDPSEYCAHQPAEKTDRNRNHMAAFLAIESTIYIDLENKSMPHINVILQCAARDVITGFTDHNRHKFVFDPQILAATVEDTGLPFEPANYPTIKDFLREAAGCEHGNQSIGDILRQHLSAVAAEHCRRPTKAVASFFTDLQRRRLDEFLLESADPAMRQREARIRRELDKLGYRLEKSRRRNPLHEGYRVFDVLERSTNVINLDAPRDFDRLERWVKTLSERPASSEGASDKKRMIE